MALKTPSHVPMLITSVEMSQNPPRYEMHHNNLNGLGIGSFVGIPRRRLRLDATLLGELSTGGMLQSPSLLISQGEFLAWLEQLQQELRESRTAFDYQKASRMIEYAVAAWAAALKGGDGPPPP